MVGKSYVEIAVVRHITGALLEAPPPRRRRPVYVTFHGHRHRQRFQFLQFPRMFQAKRLFLSDHLVYDVSGI